MPGGRPPIIDSPEEFERMAEEYFDRREAAGKPITVTGLALALGFASRQSMYDYESRDEFSCVVRKARARVESEYEANLHGTAAGGSIFALKNMGWSDRREIEHGGSMSVTNIRRTIVDPPNRLERYQTEEPATNGNGSNGSNGNGKH